MRLFLGMLVACGAGAAAPAWLSRAANHADGPLQDANCNMETVEAANSAQLHTLLKELSETAFFRLINVNMDGKCQYWGGNEEEEPACAAAEPSAPAVACSSADMLRGGVRACLLNINSDQMFFSGSKKN